MTEAELLAEIDTLFTKIQSKIDDLQNDINSALSWLPWGFGWIGDKVRDGWTWFCGKMQEFWNWISNIVSHMGSPTALSTAADAWSNNIGGPVSQEVGNADAGILLVDDNWTGHAATQYKEILPLQKAALEKIKSTFTDGISSALSVVQKAIITFWAALVAALAALVVGIIGAIVSTATIIGLPAAPFIAAAAVGVALSACWGGAQILKSLSADANTTLRQKLNDNTAYADGHWPPGVAA